MTDTGSHIWLDHVDAAPNAVAEALERGITAIFPHRPSQQVWAVKLNLTYPTYLPGAVNSPVFVEGLCQWAREHRIRLEFVEGDGGNAAYTANDAFAGNGLDSITGKYGMSCVSLNQKPWTTRETAVTGRTVRLPYSPFFAARQYDHFITAPLFKNHIYTTVSLGMKNLWGCIPDPFRMYYHHCLDRGIVALTRELRPSFSIFDGLVAMRNRGPIDGDPVPLRCLMVSSDVGAGELAALRLLNVRLEQVRHLAIAREEGLIPNSLHWLADASRFERRDFVFRRTPVDRLSIFASRFPGLQRLVYHSKLSAGIYRIVEMARGESAQTKLVRNKRLRHGVAGPPALSPKQQ